MGLYEEPPQVGEVAVLPVLDVHHAPGILPASYGLPSHLQFRLKKIVLYLCSTYCRSKVPSSVPADAWRGVAEV